MENDPGSKLIKHVATFLILLNLSSPGFAESSHPVAKPGTAEVSSTFLMGSSILFLEIFKNNLKIKTCTWCEPGLVSDRWISKKARWENPRRANVTSYISGFVALPLLSVATIMGEEYSLSRNSWKELLFYTFQSFVFTSGITQLLKFSTLRRRPFTSGKSSITTDDNLSFISGHTSTAFAIASSLATISFARGYKSRYVASAMAIFLASLTGYLRIASGKHYFTDVVVGAAVGSLVGFITTFTRIKTTEPGDNDGGTAGANYRINVSPLTFYATFRF